MATAMDVDVRVGVDVNAAGGIRPGNPMMVLKSGAEMQLHQHCLQLCLVERLGHVHWDLASEFWPNILMLNVRNMNFAFWGILKKNVSLSANPNIYNFLTFILN